MLVLTRMPEESIVISDADGGCVLTVLNVQGGEVSLLITHSSSVKPGALDAWTTKLVRDASLKIGDTAEITLVEVREDKARLGIIAPKSASVHRLEVWETMRRAQRRDSADDGEDELPGSPVRGPNGPKTPPLDARLDEPPVADDDGE